jgi:hypothetical protein
MAFSAKKIWDKITGKKPPRVIRIIHTNRSNSEIEEGEGNLEFEKTVEFEKRRQKIENINWDYGETAPVVNIEKPALVESAESTTVTTPYASAIAPNTKPTTIAEEIKTAAEIKPIIIEEVKIEIEPTIDPIIIEDVKIEDVKVEPVEDVKIETPTPSIETEATKPEEPVVKEDKVVVESVEISDVEIEPIEAVSIESSETKEPTETKQPTETKETSEEPVAKKTPAKKPAAPKATATKDSATKAPAKEKPATTKTATTTKSPAAPKTPKASTKAKAATETEEK